MRVFCTLWNVFINVLLQNTCSKMHPHTLTVVCKHRTFVASFPGPRAAFGCTKERDGPGTCMFPHVCDVEGRKVVERT